MSMHLVHLDRTTTYGHGCYPPTLGLGSSVGVFVNNKGVILKGDPIQVHCCGDPCHGGSFVGERPVYVNNKVIQVDGDPISCGDTSRGTANNVFVGD